MIALEPIGVVRSEIGEGQPMPPLGVSAVVEIFPRFLDGLHRIEKHSHIWVLAWLNNAERDLLQVKPRGLKDAGDEGLHGVFAVRSPARPNPVGLTATRVLGIKQLSIHVERLDFRNGTPVVDVKPYFVSRDMIFSASNVQIGKPLTPEAAREALLLQAIHFHGELCEDLDRAVNVMARFRAEVLEWTDPEGWTVTVPADRPCIADAFMGMLRVSPGRRNLVFGAPGKISFERGADRYTYDI